MSTTIYPHPPSVLRVTPFPERQGKGVAAVTLAYGPVVIRAKLFQGERGLFLSLPSRKNEEKDTWFNQVYFQDRTLHDLFENMAVAEYQRLQSARLEDFSPPLFAVAS